MAYDVVSYKAVMALLGTGLSDYRIARETGVKRGTVRNWRLAAHPPQAIERDTLAATWSVQEGSSSCYLLGTYLGDGTVNVQKGIWLQIVNDRRYPGISKEILAAMARTFPGRTPRMHPSSVGESDVLCILRPVFLHQPLRRHPGGSSSTTASSSEYV
jgi:hypothetical protein